MRLSDLDGLSVGIWGLGREGRAALDAVRSRARPRAVWVYTPQDTLEGVEAGLVDRHLHGPGGAAGLAECDAVIRSPGVSLHDPQVRELRRAGVRLTTGTNLWFSEPRGDTPVVAVTGTKGKSTTAALLAHLASAGGTAARLGGNVGTPLLSLLDQAPADLYVLELSSFQIADLEGAPTVGIVLNLHREHLDWHGSERRYHRDKLRLVEPGRTALPVLNARDERLRALLGHRRDARWFGDARGVHVRDGAFADGAGRPLAAVTELPLRGEHNALNACAALEALAALGRLTPAAVGALASFRALPHRLELARDSGPVSWVNDSISTTAESAIAAVRSFPGRHVTLIAGGHDRAQRYDELAAVLASHRPSAAVVALPQTGGRLLDALARRGAAVPTRAAPDLDRAVVLARSLTPDGGVVLLSPAAPSFGAYRDFEERGEHFRRLAGTADAPG